MKTITISDELHHELKVLCAKIGTKIGVFTTVALYRGIEDYAESERIPELPPYGRFWKDYRMYGASLPQDNVSDMISSHEIAE